jgi:ubiquinone/menaquinone biosynthesis C-methylase UbiE
MNLEDLKFSNNIFTHSFASLLLMAMDDPEKAASEIHCTLKPGGTALTTIWEKFGWLPFAYAAQRSAKPEATLFPVPVSPEWQTEDRLRSYLDIGGF